MRAMVFDRINVRYVVVLATLLLAVIVPAVVSAAQLQERSIALSSSSADADNVTYEVNFTPTAAAEKIVLNFCSNSPLIGQTCEAPAGFSVAGAATSTAGFSGLTVINANTLAVTADEGVATTPVSIAFTGINNPTAAGSLYARILTYDTAYDTSTYTPTAVGSPVDTGGAAIAITDTVGVSGSVLESLTFCVAGIAIGEDCAVNEADPQAAPVLELGDEVSPGVYALVPGNEPNEGSIFTQLSTNAATGAVVSLKSNAVGCGGLLRAGAEPGTCDIKPALTNGVDGTEARFGVRVSQLADTATGALGVLQPYTATGYNANTFVLNYVNTNATGVTSTYGDLFLDTAGAPANNKNVELIFGASVTNATPAGRYSADLSLIATGKY